MINRNGCGAVDPPQSKAKPGKTRTTAEARRSLIGAESDGLSPLWTLALTTGARQGELLGLRWQDLDLDRGTLTVRQAISVHGDKLIFQAPKSGAALRTIALPAETATVLRSHRVR